MLHSARLTVNELTAQKCKNEVKAWSKRLEEKERSPCLILWPMPPLVKRLAASLSIKLEDKDAVLPKCMKLFPECRSQDHSCIFSPTRHELSP